MNSNNYLVPNVVERSADGERSYDLYSRLLKERIIFLNGEVNDNLSQLVVAQMLFLESEDSERDIYLYVNGPGGSITSGMAIYDTMQFVKCDVATIVQGQAASMSSFLAMAGAAGKRFSLPGSRFMIHQPLGGTGYAQATDIDIAAKEILRIKHIMTQKYVDHNTAGKTYDDFREAMERDRYLSAEESREWGMVDHVITNRSDLAKIIKD